MRICVDVILVRRCRSWVYEFFLLTAMLNTCWTENLQRVWIWILRSFFMQSNLLRLWLGWFWCELNKLSFVNLPVTCTSEPWLVEWLVFAVVALPFVRLDWQLVSSKWTTQLVSPVINGRSTVLIELFTRLFGNIIAKWHRTNSWYKWMNCYELEWSIILVILYK